MQVRKRKGRKAQAVAEFAHGFSGSRKLPAAVIVNQNRAARRQQRPEDPEPLPYGFVEIRIQMDQREAGKGFRKGIREMAGAENSLLRVRKT